MALLTSEGKRERKLEQRKNDEISDVESDFFAIDSTSSGLQRVTEKINLELLKRILCFIAQLNVVSAKSRCCHGYGKKAGSYFVAFQTPHLPHPINWFLARG